MKTALMFPGAGSYFTDPFAHYSRGQCIAAELAEEIDGVCATYRWPSVFSVTAQDPTHDGWPHVVELRTYHAQLCCWRILVEECGLSAEIFVGHSLGEITALVAAGGFTVEDGARLLCERAVVLQAHAQPTAATAAFMVSPEEAEVLARQRDGVVVAAVNSPTQGILSGPAEEIQRLLHLAQARGISATLLRTGPYPQHHPCLGAASEQYLAEVGGIRQERLRTAVHSTILGRKVLPSDDLARIAALQMVAPLDFAQATTDLSAAGIQRFVECGLKDTLSRLVAEILGETVYVWAPFSKRLADTDVRSMRTDLVLSQEEH
ncbi:acyltransferase domain-containing protein [Saccharopolyspora sp. ASAGF58]|uniref:acyltransferase domain-containing protein n=1 Tax=Saccharopolyspora sp. ASAGF58 TaxID=2719023 RepID=UPI0014486810|nr:acyltransferase domain-containing protein [Saccharopolyspora sp. ASAGF58]